MCTTPGMPLPSSNSVSLFRAHSLLWISQQLPSPDPDGNADFYQPVVEIQKACGFPYPLHGALGTLLTPVLKGLQIFPRYFRYAAAGF